MANSKMSSTDVKGDKHLLDYDERFLSDDEALQFRLEKEIRILMIGKSGEGKSATGNTMMGKTWFVSDSSGKSVTQKGKLGKLRWQDRLFKIVDTPGLFDNKMSEKDLKVEIVKCMTLILPGPHIIMYVIRLGRYTQEDIGVAYNFLKIFDGNPFKFVIIVLTGRDDLDFHHKTPANYLKTVILEFKSFAEKCNGRLIFVNNRSKDSKCEWISMYAKIDQMLIENELCYYTSKLLEKLDENFNRELARHVRDDDENFTKEKIRAIIEKEVENEGPFFQSLLESTTIGAIIGGFICAIVGLSFPLIGVGVVVGGGIGLTRGKKCSIS